MTTNSRLGKIIPVTGATLIALALSGVRAQAADMAQDPAPMQTPSAMQPQAGAQGHAGGAVQAQAPMEGVAKSMDDALITTKVKAELLKDQSLKSLQIHVATRKGVVHLTGNVANSKDASRAVQVAQAVPGVRMVMSDLHVQG
ncbi:Transport-associated protein [Thiomonas sp. X19]|uniref:BON domain-containing protein n=1 Tax=Thiomonas sp. X19 TaxID=1050370 RepID=UPI000B631041|nr:BON domain-containing protein [Thiomonas sp. X19]SCC91580.1 Transport-associated protein [Thiomonas sp. X19]